MWIWTGSLLFFSRVCKLRLDDHAQSETRIIAEKIHDICAILFPVCWKALMKRQDPPSGDEMEALRGEITSLRKSLNKANSENSKILQRLNEEKLSGALHPRG
jgi:thymidylate synthase ThyX